MPDWSVPHDPLGAFCRENHAARKGHAQGPLSGLTFAAKDAFHIEGVRTGFGQPDWLRTHPPATVTARAVTLLLEGGADMVAKTHCDELCYSLTGENAHYVTPENVNAPGRVPGGSSNGSAAAVAGGLVDFALGSDCGGSVRIPASYCGIFGMRPTWGRVPLDGALPFGPSFDVAGWLTRSPQLFERVGRVLLQDQSLPQQPRRLLIAKDAFALVEDQVVQALMPAVERVTSEIGAAQDVVVSDDGLAVWFEAFRTIQAAEIWGSLGAWITATKPQLGPGVRERLEWAATVSTDMVAEASARREQIRRRMADLVQPGDILCLPTSPRVAPLKGTPTDKVEVEYRNQAMCLLCISGHTGMPQVSLPMALLDGLPLGLSLLGARGADVDLLALSRRLF
jgi:amidase